MVKEIVATAEPKMDKAIEHLVHELGTLRTGRASAAMLDSVMVEYYGAVQPLKTVASITVPDGHSLAITPWDKGAMGPIEKAIRDNQSLGFNPMNDGVVIRINVPALTEERRKDMVKSLGVRVEDCRVALRNARHDVLNDAKRQEKSKDITTDDVKAVENELAKLVEKYQKRIEELEQTKSKEIMAI